MIHTKYGTDNPTHDIMKEVPCAIVANQEALADEFLFSLIPDLLVAEAGSITVGIVALAICTRLFAAAY
jgi:hypothetical protein